MLAHIAGWQPNLFVVVVGLLFPLIASDAFLLPSTASTATRAGKIASFHEDKLKMSSRHVVQADGSFALRGIVGGPSGYWRKDGLRQLPSGGEQVLKTSQPSVPLSGVRTIHGSRMLSEPTRGVISNRPLSPHLPVKKPQLYASFSISHRIFGMALTSLIMVTPIAYKLSVLYDV